MKKKVLTVAVVVALIAIMVSGTLAYFTAEDKVTNTFTVGSVLIEIYENGEKTNEDVIAIDKPLTPVVNATPSADESYIHKAIKVQSTGENAAYIRTLLGVPKQLVGYLEFDLNTDGSWTHVSTFDVVAEDGITYTVYVYDHTAKVEPDLFTLDVLKGVYLASSVDLKDNPDTQSADLEFCKPNGDGTYTFSGFIAHNKVTDGYTTNTVSVLVAAQAIQAQGFSDATTALNTGFPVGTNPWGTIVTNP